MTINDLYAELQELAGGPDGGRTVHVSVGGLSGTPDHIAWRYGDPVLVADKADEPDKPKAGRETGNGD